MRRRALVGSMRRRALVGAFVALASLAAAGFTALVLLGLDTGDQPGPSPDTTETYDRAVVP
jgi:hypothetical protein